MDSHYSPYPPQPGYPQPFPSPIQPQNSLQLPYPQPGFPGSYLQPPRKRKTSIWITGIIIVVLLIGGAGAIYYLNQGVSSPQQTLQTFCHALISGDYQTAYNQVSSHLKSTMSESEFASLFQTIGSVKNCSLLDVTQDSSTEAHGRVEYTLSSGLTEVETDTLVYENGAWKIDSASNQQLQ